MREKILSADDLESRLVDVPEWDVTVEMRTPSVRRRGELMAEYMRDGELDYVRMYPALVIACAHDPEDHTTLFSTADIEPLTEKSAAAMERLGKVATELSGMGDVQGQVDEGKDGS